MSARALAHERIRKVTRGLAEPLWSLWCRFWFESRGEEPLRLFRFLFGLLLLGCYLSRATELELFYSNGPRGAFPFEIIGAASSRHPSLLSLFHSTTALWTLYVMLLLNLGAMALDFAPRLSAALAFSLHLSFIHRNLWVTYGLDHVASFFLFYLSFADGRPWGGGLRGMASSLAYRLLQLQPCVIYAYSGLEKLQYEQWWNGDALWYALSNPQIARWDLSWVCRYPAVLRLLGAATMLWELCFPVLVWVRPLRPSVLSWGIALHLGIAVLLRLPFFGAVMIASYALYLEKSVAESWTRGAPRVGPRPFA